MTPLELPAIITAQTDPGRAPELCAWWLKCDETATTTRPHSVLGAVPVCEGCAARIDSINAH